MDFLDPVKERRYTIQLFIGYFLVAIAIAFATAILVHLAYGYGVTRDGSLIQKGLVFVSSRPTNANVYIDGKRQKTTNIKLNLNAGSYEVSLRRDGYHDWERRITVPGGSVNHYVYPLLIPTELTIDTIDILPAKPALVTQSRDQRWLVVQPEPGDEFNVYDLNRGQTTVGNPVAFEVPETLLTPSETPARWEVLQWSSNNRHMLAKRTFTLDDTATFEYVLVDRQRPAGSHNLTEELELTPAVEVKLRDDKPDLYYLHDTLTNELSAASLSDPEAQLVIEEVLAYKSHDQQRILYVTEADAEEGQANVMLKDGDETFFIRSVARSDTYLLDIARYDGSWYVVAGSKHENRVYLFEDPVASIRSSNAARAVSAFGFNVSRPTKVTFSSNAQFILVQNANRVHVYDAEYVRAFNYDLPFPVAGPEKYATWMDGHRLSYVSGGQQVMFDYDGINQHALVETHQDFGGYYDRDSRFLYTFLPVREGGETAWHLRSTPLRTPNDL